MLFPYPRVENNKLACPTCLESFEEESDYFEHYYSNHVFAYMKTPKKAKVEISPRIDKFFSDLIEEISFMKIPKKLPEYFEPQRKHSNIINNLEALHKEYKSLKKEFL